MNKPQPKAAAPAAAAAPVTSYAIVQRNGQYSMVTTTTVGTTVTDQQFTTPDSFAIAKEAFKIAAGKLFIAMGS